MSEQQQATGGSEQVTSGDPEGQKDVVAYESYNKLLSEKKKLQDEFKNFKSEYQKLIDEKKEREENELKQKENYKQLLEMRDSELQQTKELLKQREQREIEARKLDAVLRNVGGEIDRKYWDLIDTNKIAFDPESNQIDEMSVTKYVEQFRETYPETIKGKRVPGVPNEAPRPERKLSINEMSPTELNRIIAERLVNERKR